MNLSTNKIAILLTSIFFLFGVLTLPHYGINWDTINHLPRGQAYLNYFLTGKKDFSNLKAWKDYWQDPNSLFIKSNIPKGDITRSLYQSDGTTFSWFMSHDGNGHPPLSDILSSIFNVVFFQKLKLVNDIDSYRLYSVLLSSILVGLIYKWLADAFNSKIAGFVGSLSLSMYPLFLSESHFNNEKDIPETVYWSIFIYCVWRWYKGKNIKWILASGVFFGLALGTKFNIFFIPFVIVPWLAVLFFSNFPKKIKEKSKYLKTYFKLLFSGVLALFIGLGIFFGSWPYLWPDPIGRVQTVFKFYKDIGLTSNVDPRFVGLFKTNTYPIEWITFTTPIVIIFFFIIGFIYAFGQIKKREDKLTLLFLLWLAVPILRVITPGTTIYGGIRQIMEYIPAMALISGMGAFCVKDFLSKKTKGKYTKIISALIVLSFIPITLKLIKIHPNENVYFNPIIGGLKGASENGIPSWGNTFGAAYRQGISWIDKNAEPNANVVLAYELLPNVPRIFVRNDLNFQNSNRSGYLRKGEYAMTLVYYGTEDRSYYDNYLEKFVKPVYQADVDGVAVLKVWKNSDQYLYKPWQEDLIKNPKYSITKEGIIVDLGKSEPLSRLEISYDQNSCSELKQGIVSLSNDSKKWVTLPGVLPQSWRISYLKVQPYNGHFIEPFVGQSDRFIKLELTPSDACLKKITDIKIYKLL